MFGSAASGMPASRMPRSARSATVGPAPWFVPIAATPSPARRRAAVLGTDPSRDLGLVVEGEERHDRERRDRAHRLDRDDELVEVEERLDHEQVDAPTFEHAGLCRVERAVLGRVEHLELAERPDRAGDEHVSAGDLPCLARKPHACGVDLLEGVVEQCARELPPVRTEGVRLDQLRTRRDVSGMDGDHALGSLQVRLLWAPEAMHGSRDERAHAAVGDERQARAEAFEEAAHEPATLDSCRELIVRRSAEAGLPPCPASPPSVPLEEEVAPTLAPCAVGELGLSAWPVAWEITLPVGRSVEPGGPERRLRGCAPP